MDLMSCKIQDQDSLDFIKNRVKGAHLKNKLASNKNAWTSQTVYRFKR